MDQNQNTTPAPVQTPPSPAMNQMPEMEHKSSVGPIIGSIIIVLIIILGGLYLYGDKLGMSENDAPETEEALTAEEISAKVDASTEALQSQGTTDSLTEIEADLSATDLSNLDAELKNIDGELNF